MAAHPYTFPDEPITQILDDAKAWQIIESLGFIEQFLQPERTGTLPKNCTVILAQHHPTHWVLCMRHANNPEEAENGFMVIAYLKDQVSFQQVTDVIRNHFSANLDVSCKIVIPEENT